MPGKLKREISEGIKGLLDKSPHKTISVLAEAVGLYPMTALRILGGDTSHTHLVTCGKVAAALKCSLDDLAHICLERDRDRGKKRFRERATAAGIMTQSQLQVAAGVSKGTAYNFFTNDRDHGMLGNYRDIARGLNISLDELFSVLISADTTRSALTESSSIDNIHDVENPFLNSPLSGKIAA